MLRVPALLFGPLAGIAAAGRRRDASALCTLAAIVIAAGFGCHDPSRRQARRALGARSRRPDGRRRGARFDLARLARSRLPEPQGAHRPAGDAPLGAACAATPRRAARRRRRCRRATASSRVSTERADESRRGRRRRRRAKIEAPPRRARPRGRAAPKRSSGGYQLPVARRCSPRRSRPTASRRAQESIQENATALESVLEDFGVRGEIINARPGPVVTLYELEPAPGIKSSRVIGLADDIARSMSALSARVAVVSGPQRHRHRTAQRQAREGLSARAARRRRLHRARQAKLPLCLGKTIGGEPVIVDLARMPHLLIAGTTGSGKSVAINTMILSLLYRLHARAVPADHGRSEDARTLGL